MIERPPVSLLLAHRPLGRRLRAVDRTLRLRQTVQSECVRKRSLVALDRYLLFTQCRLLVVTAIRLGRVKISSVLDRCPILLGTVLLDE